MTDTDRYKFEVRMQVVKDVAFTLTPAKDEDFPIFVRYRCWRCGSVYTELFERDGPYPQYGRHVDCVDCGQALWVLPPANEG